MVCLYVKASSEFNKFHKQRVLQDRLKRFLEEHGEQHVEHLGGVHVVLEMLEADYDLEKAKRVQFRWQEVQETLMVTYRENVPGLAASGFFEELRAKRTPTLEG